MSNRILIAVGVALMLSTGMMAQSGAASKFEIGVGLAPFIDRYMMVWDGPYKSKYEAAAFAEWRLGLGRHFDCGAILGYAVGPTDGIAPGVSFKGVGHVVELLAFGDFNILPGKKVNPYLGIAMGPLVDIQKYDYKPEPEVYFCKLSAGPRIGVELFDHLRISVESVFHIFGGYNIGQPICLNVGWTF